MRKTYLLAGALFLTLASCEKQDELILETQIPTPAENQVVNQDSSIQDSTLKKASVTKLSDFNIIYSECFDDNTVGAYRPNEWQQDWNFPDWANKANGLGSIVEYNKNRFLKESFPKNKFGLKYAGVQWQTPLNKGYEELYLSYRIKFSKGFVNRSYHGKLPGLSGGKSNGGGDLPTGKDGWSARYMFHGTSINFYLYHPEIYKDAGDAKPIKGKKYYGRGAYLAPGYTLTPEVWYTITQRIVMNTVGKSNGLVEGYVNGRLCAVQTGIRFRDVASLSIDKISFSNFFGGSGIAPLANEDICFDDFYVYTYKNNKLAKGNVENKEGTVISLPK